MEQHAERPVGGKMLDSQAPSDVADSARSAFELSVAAAVDETAGRLGITLSPEQVASSRWGFGLSSILATAGAGKTTVMAITLAGLSRALGGPSAGAVGLSQGAERMILGAAFTRDGARNLRERVELYLGRPTMARITTLHGYSRELIWRLWKDLGYAARPEVMSESMAERRLAQAAMAAFGVGRRKDLPLTPSQLSSAVTEMDLAGALPVGTVGSQTGGVTGALGRKAIPPIHAAALSVMRREFRERNHRDGVVDFDTILFEGLTLLNRAATDSSIMARLRPLIPLFVFLDEAQDLDEMQWGMAERLSDFAHSLTTIGDDDQAIYGWRGAAPQRFVDFSRGERRDGSSRPVRQLRLTANRRSLPDIVQFAGEVISRVPAALRIEKALTATRAGEGGVVYAKPRASEEYIEQAVARISSDIAAGLGRPGDYAFLFRGARGVKAFTQVQSALLRAKIPYTVSGGASAVEMPEVALTRDFLVLVMAAARTLEPLDFWEDALGHLGVTDSAAEGIVSRAFGRDSGLGAIERTRLVLEETATSRIRTDTKALVMAFVGLVAERREHALRLGNAAWGTEPTPEGAPILPAATALAAPIWTAAGATAGLADLVLKEVSHRLAEGEVRREERRGGKLDKARVDEEIDIAAAERVDAWGEILASVGAAAADEAASLLSTEVRDRGGEPKEGGSVAVSTVHQAKGLEWRRVHVMQVVTGVWPYERPGDLMAPRGEHLAAIDHEQRRLFYVAVTRARDELLLVGSPGDRAPWADPSPYLPDLLKRDVWEAWGRRGPEIVEVPYRKPRT